MASVGKTPRLCVDTGGSAAAQGGGAGGSSEQQHGISEQPFTPSFSAASVQEEPVLEPVLEPVAKVSEIAAQYLQARKRRLHVDHVARARHAPVADPRLANNLHALADLSRPRQQWLRHVPITDLPEPAALDAGSVRVGSGPVHSRVHQQLKEDLQADRVDFDLVLHENEESRRSMAAFRGYLGSLPEEHQVVWNMYHGIRSHPGENAGFTTESTRLQPLQLQAPNADRAAVTRNRLGDGLYFSSNLCYNFNFGRAGSGFYEVCSNNAVGFLLCYVAPGNYHNVGTGHCQEMSVSPEQCHSRLGVASSKDHSIICCVDQQEAVHVWGECYIRGVW
jgi:hypothetical protein